LTTQTHWTPAYIGVGSNLDDPAAQVRRALRALGELNDSLLVCASPLYSNPPMGPQEQPDYVNAVAALLTRKGPEALLLSLQELERNLGRVRLAGDRWGPRVIDLDLLIYGLTECSLPGLDLPHPGIAERNFVLFPLRDIAPRLWVPGQGTVEVLAGRLSDADLVAVQN
jgi:2-amino-4-hydroxy-6-hydroxymethyldihydropteridine diphosphokinase